MTSEGWETLTLDQVATYQNGRATKPAEVQDSGMAVVKIRELNSGITGNTDRVDPARVQQKHIVDEGDLLFAWSASVGIYIWPGPMAALNQHIFKVDAKPGTDQGFLRYLLEYELRALKAAAGERQTTMGHVRKADLERLTCRRPAIHEQQAIAEVLGGLDGRIEWIHSVQSKLRQTTHAWFRLRCLAGDVKALGELTETVPGRSYKSADLAEDSTVGLVNLKNIPRHGGFEPDGIKGYTGPYKEAQEVMRGDLVVACTDMTQQGDVIGRAGRVRSHPDYDRLVISMDMAAVRPAVDWLSREFLFELMSTPEWVHHVKRYVNGTTVLHLKKKAIAEYVTPIPEPETVADFTDFARPMWELHDDLEKEATRLREVRDSLLPKLLSGELRINDPLRLAGAVA